ncbi:MAG: phytoene synthase [Halobacteriales archaeon]|jgi:phytoene synthase
MKEKQIRRGKAIQRRTGSTFHLATRLLPKRIRYPTYVLYGFFRIADEVVDGAETPSPDEQARRLENLRDAALGNREPDDPVLEAFQDLKPRNDIADEEVDAFVDAMKADIATDRYETIDDLDAYMRGSASAVGVMMTDVMDLDEEAYHQALPHAVALGKAFQLTNFVRDVREDVVDLDRIYLPRAVLREHGVDPANVEALELTPAIAAAVEAELKRAERLYREGVAGIRYLPEDCQFAVLASAVLYAEHHRLIRDRDFDVISETPELGLARSLTVLARTRWHWTWNKNPEAVFRRVSAVPSREGSAHRTDHEYGEGVPVR